MHHKIKEERGAVEEVFASGRVPVIYVCGRAKNMPKAVERAFSEVVGEDKIQEMKKYGFYKVEAW